MIKAVLKNDAAYVSRMRCAAVAAVCWHGSWPAEWSSSAVAAKEPSL